MPGKIRQTDVSAPHTLRKLVGSYKGRAQFTGKKLNLMVKFNQSSMTVDWVAMRQGSLQLYLDPRSLCALPC